MSDPMLSSILSHIFLINTCLFSNNSPNFLCPHKFFLSSLLASDPHLMLWENKNQQLIIIFPSQNLKSNSLPCLSNLSLCCIYRGLEIYLVTGPLFTLKNMRTSKSFCLCELHLLICTVLVVKTEILKTIYFGIKINTFLWKRLFPQKNSGKNDLVL